MQADLIEGIIAANGLESPAADRTRAALWQALETERGTSDAAVDAA